MASEGAEIPELAGTIRVEGATAGGAPGLAEQATKADGGEAPAPASAQAPKADTAGPPAPSSSWTDRLREVAMPLCTWLSRPRVRLTVTGIILLVVGGLFLTSSAWTMPLVIVGALMVVIAWVGRRIDGRLAVAWGETGTQLEFRAEIKAAPSAQPRPALNTSGVRGAETTPADEPQDADIVEGEAHTIEIEVAELKALLAAAETAEAEIAQTVASAQATRNLRVANGGDSASEAAR